MGPQGIPLRGRQPLKPAGLGRLDDGGVARDAVAGRDGPPQRVGDHRFLEPPTQGAGQNLRRPFAAVGEGQGDDLFARQALFQRGNDGGRHLRGREAVLVGIRGDDDHGCGGVRAFWTASLYLRETGSWVSPTVTVSGVLRVARSALTR